MTDENLSEELKTAATYSANRTQKTLGIDLENHAPTSGTISREMLIVASAASEYFNGMTQACQLLCQLDGEVSPQRLLKLSREVAQELGFIHSSTIKPSEENE